MVKLSLIALLVGIMCCCHHSATSYDLNYNPKWQSCNSIATDIKYGPSSVIKNLTNPEYYDFRKRPNAAHIIDERASHLPDRAWVTLHVRSVVNIDQIRQSITTRWVSLLYMIINHRHYYNVIIQHSFACINVERSQTFIQCL
jgi:hypothetical protein